MCKQLIADKRLVIQAEIEKWAAELAILGPDQRIISSIEIVSVKDPKAFINMPVQEFFTRTRFLEAGIARTQATYVSSFLIEALRTDVPLLDPFEKKHIATVSEFVQYLPRIYYLTYLGDRRKNTKSWQYIHQVLRDAGFDLKE